jgi:hypothetical protein
VRFGDALPVVLALALLIAVTFAGRRVWSGTNDAASTRRAHPRASPEVEG